MYLIFMLFLQGAAALPEELATYEPHPAEQWVHSSEFRCGRMTVRISGYGNARPSTRPVALIAGGRALAGRGSADLRRDLANRRAVYRLGAVCSRDGRIMELRISSGEKLQDGTVLYRIGSAFIRDGSMRDYTGLEPANAESFWFR